MTMPTFEPVAMRSIVLNRANKLAANSNFYIDGFEAHKMGNLVQAIFETIESQLPQAYEAGLRDAVPEGFTLVPNEPTMPMLIELNEIAIIVAGLGHEDGPQRVLTDGYKAMLAAAPKGD